MQFIFSFDIKNIIPENHIRCEVIQFYDLRAIRHAPKNTKAAMILAMKSLMFVVAP